MVGSPGRIGRLTVEALARGGHETVGISRAQGGDLYTGEGLAAALAGVASVIDASSTDREDAVEFFSRSTRNLLDSGRQAGVQHHVLLSIVGLAKWYGNAHAAGKRAQEALVEQGPVPWSIVPATEFHDFAEMVTTWTEQDGSATIAPLLGPGARIAPTTFDDWLSSETGQ